MKPTLLVLPLVSDAPIRNHTREVGQVVAIMEDALSLEPAQVEALAGLASAIGELKAQLGERQCSPSSNDLWAASRAATVLTGSAR